MIQRQAWGVETILTCIFVIVVFAATDAQRASSTAHLPVSRGEGVAVIACQLHAVAPDALVPSELPLATSTGDLYVVHTVAALQGRLCRIVSAAYSTPAAYSSTLPGHDFASMPLPLRLLDWLIGPPCTPLLQPCVLAKHSTGPLKCQPAPMARIVPLSILTMQHQRAICAFVPLSGSKWHISAQTDWHAGHTPALPC